MHDVAVRPWNVIELCAGAGGLGLGIELAVPGARGVAYVEREAAAAALLVGRMESGDLAPAPVWSDLATFDARPWRGRVHCVASGDPCQPNSHAGKGLGAADERFLIDQVLRVTGECRPLRLFRENVTGNAAGQLAALVGPLESMGYRVAAGIFSSAETGNSHGRERLIVMADLLGGGQPQLAQLDGGAVGQRQAAFGGGHPLRRNHEVVDAEGFGWGEGWPEHAGEQGRPSVALSGSQLADSTGWRRLQGREVAAGRQQPISRQGGHALAGHADGKLADALRERPQGLGPGDDPRGWEITPRHAGLCGRAGVPLIAPGPADPRWPEILALDPSLEPALCRVAHAVADRVDRLRLCGNGVDPVAAAYAWVALDALHRAARGGTEAGALAVRAAA